MILDDRIRDDPGKLSSLAGSIMYRVKGSQMRYFDEASPRNSVDTAPLDHSVFNYSLQKRGYSSTALEWISWLSIDVGKQSEDKVELVIKQVQGATAPSHRTKEVREAINQWHADYSHRDIEEAYYIKTARRNVATSKIYQKLEKNRGLTIPILQFGSDRYDASSTFESKSFSNVVLSLLPPPKKQKVHKLEQAIGYALKFFESLLASAGFFWSSKINRCQRI